MDEHALASELLTKMFMMNKARPQRKMNDGMRGESVVLQFVIFHDGAVLPSEISAFMNISTARTAAALNSLERKGLVTRNIDPSDRRRILVTLTDRGEAYAREERNHMLKHTTLLIRRLGEKDATEFVRIMGRVAEIVTDLHGDCDGTSEMG